MPSLEGLRLKYFESKRKMFAPLNQKSLVNIHFTIISNNCWGGMTYENYGLKKESPTVGLFFVASDYIKFLKNLELYLKAPLLFIDPKISRWRDEAYIYSDSRFGHYPVGVLDIGSESIEIFFLHAHNQSEAREKWTRRCKRVNFDNMLVKFNDQNGCTENELEEFLNLPYKNKIFFTTKKWNRISAPEIIYIPHKGNDRCIRASEEPFYKSSHLNVSKLINTL